MGPRARAAASYAPGLVLFVAGLIALVAIPFGGYPTCPCSTGPNGTVCPTCAPVAVPVVPLGLLLIVASGIYVLSAFLVRLTLRLNPPIRG